MSISVTTVLGPVTIKECFEGYEAGIDITRGPYVKKVYLCPTWASAFPVINALMGTGYSPVGHICPESTNLRCLSAVLAPEAEYDIRDNGRPRFNLPKVIATYGVQLWEAQTSDDPEGAQSFPDETGTPYLFMEQTIEFDTEVIKLPNSAYKFSSPPSTPVDVPCAKTIGVAQFVLVRHYQQILPYSNVTTYMNKLNASTFLGQPRGQIKFRKGRCRRQFTSDGTRGQEVEYVFQWREYDHNKFHRPDESSFDTIEDSAGDMPYTYTDLTPLLS